MKDTLKNKRIPILWSSAAVLLFGILIARAALAEHLWLTIVLAVGFVGVTGALIHENRKALRTRQAALGINSIVTSILVIAIIGVVNFLGARHPGTIDTTRTKAHTLSDQTTKLVKELKRPVQAVLFQGSTQAGAVKSLLDKMKGLNTNLEVDYVDPNKEPMRVRQAGIKKMGTLLLTTTNAQGSTREQRIEEPTEEKLTNGLIKLLQEKNSILCAITGHGERSFTGQEAEGYEASRRALANQNYEVKDLQLSQETKIDPEKCNAIAIIGPSKALFPKEVQLIDEYLAAGGRAIISLDIDPKGNETAEEIQKLLSKWNIKAARAVVLDPFARMAGSDAAVPVTRNFSRENPITKDMQIQTYFPLARPIEQVPGAPASLKLDWLVKTNDAAWGETDFGSLGRGQVQNNKGVDIAGPVTVAMAAKGKLKDSKAGRDTRIVVFGSSAFANNSYSRFGANIDLFANSVSWVLEDENLISIRSKEDAPGKIELTQAQNNLIFIGTVLVLPFLIAVAGIVIWVRRRKL